MLGDPSDILSDSVLGMLALAQAGGKRADAAPATFRTVRRFNILEICR